jgi:hypothetical protein
MIHKKCFIILLLTILVAARASSQDYKKAIEVVQKMEANLETMLAKEESQRKTEVASLRLAVADSRTAFARTSTALPPLTPSPDSTSTTEFGQRLEILQKEVGDIRPSADMNTLAGELSSLLAELNRTLESTKQASPSVAEATTPPNQSPASNNFRATIIGFVDTYYSYNFQQPQSHLNKLRNFDIYENQFSLNLAEVKFALEGSSVGGNLELTFGPTADLVHTIDGKADETFKYIHQAYATVRVPVGDMLTVDVGKFVTHLGAEVIETHMNWNYSRSLLFAWAIPYFHTGVRLTYPLSSNLSLMGMVANGWNRIVDNNSAKTLGAQIAWTPVEGLSVIQNWISGAEQTNNNNDKRTVWDAIIAWQLSDRWALNVNFDYGYETVDGSKVFWKGLAGMARYSLNQALAFALRGESFDDRHGFQTGAVQQLHEVTFTGEWKVNDQLLLRAELRRDWSDIGFFETKSGLSTCKEQNTFMLGWIFNF